MSFKILLLAPDADPSWPKKIRRAVPGVVVNAYSDPQDALDDIADADAAYGTVPPELLARARKLRWICAARAGLGGAWFYDALVNDRGNARSAARCRQGGQGPLHRCVVKGGAMRYRQIAGGGAPDRRRLRSLRSAPQRLGPAACRDRNVSS